VRTARTGPVHGLVAQLGLLAGLAATVGLTPIGWVAGAAVGVTTATWLRIGLARAGHGLGPANRVTLARAVIVGGVAALVGSAYGRTAPLAALTGLAAVALVLDALDGWVARRTASASALGARFDMEVDAFLILVLSVYVARTAGAWVLLIGAARYAFGVADVLLPWWRSETLPPRYWRKVVAATQGIVLTAAAADVLPAAWTNAVLGGALAMLAESFGRDVWWLWRRRVGTVPRTGIDRVAGETPVPDDPVPAHDPRLTTVAAGGEPVGAREP
jgi:phosphatidylglycerophosphate synthase